MSDMGTFVALTVLSVMIAIILWDLVSGLLSKSLKL